MRISLLPGLAGYPVVPVACSSPARRVLYSGQAAILWIPRSLMAMRDRITEALKCHDAEYVEIRLEESEGAHIRYRGRELEETGRTSGGGGNVRALAGGGWGFVCFNDLEGLRDKIALAVSHARLVGGEPVRLAPVEPSVDIVVPVIKKDPRAIPQLPAYCAYDQHHH